MSPFLLSSLRCSKSYDFQGIICKSSTQSRLFGRVPPEAWFFNKVDSSPLVLGTSPSPQLLPNALHEDIVSLQRIITFNISRLQFVKPPLELLAIG